MSDEPTTAGAELRRAREAAGMSLAQVSDATRVRRAVLEALEADDLDPSGGLTYARGHIKSVCAVLGVDPAPVLARLGAPTVAQSSPHLEEVAPAPQVRSLGGALGGTDAARAEPRRPNWSAVMAAALVLVLALGGYQLLRGNQGPATPPSALPGPTTSSPTAPGGQPVVPPSSPAPGISEPGDPIARADGVSVVLTITGEASWVSAQTSKGTVFEGTLTKGERRTFKDSKKVKFVFGNAGAVGLRVNGIEVGAPGGPGQVVRTTFGPGDPDSSRA